MGNPYWGGAEKVGYGAYSSSLMSKSSLVTFEKKMLFRDVIRNMNRHHTLVAKRDGDGEREDR